jgi:hypothetical protein
MGVKGKGFEEKYLWRLLTLRGLFTLFLGLFPFFLALLLAHTTTNITLYTKHH